MIIFGLIFACFAVFGLVMFLDGYYYRTSPREPDPTIGKIYSLQVKTAKGVARVYLTRSQILPSQLIFWVLPNPLSDRLLLEQAMESLSESTRAHAEETELAKIDLNRA